MTAEAIALASIAAASIVSAAHGAWWAAGWFAILGVVSWRLLLP